MRATAELGDRYNNTRIPTMFATLRSFDRRAVRLLGVAFAGAMALAACDTDKPMAPKHPDSPTAAQPVLFTIGGTLVIKVVDTTQALITNSLTEFKVVGPNKATWVVKDNIANDADPTTGVLRMKGLAAGQYQICETVAPVSYAMPNPACVTATVSAYTATVSIMHQTVARAQWSVIDYVPNYVPGMVFTLRDSTNAIVTFITDNVGADSDPAGGKFDIRWATEGVYKLCEDTPPAGYSYPNGQAVFCATIQLKHGTIWQAGQYTVYPTYSAYWKVTDGTIDPNFYYHLIGPSTFTVVNVLGGPAITVVDNGANDIDGDLGTVVVKLTQAGTYSICETVPPNGYWNAQPACKQVQVAAAEAGWAEWFINQEKQVYKP
jgi:hypothetical protein